MTPEEKAKELVERFSKQQINESSFENFQVAKQCALICVDEILDEYERSRHPEVTTEHLESYWQQVKQEIEKL